MLLVTFGGMIIGCSRGILKPGVPQAAIVGEPLAIIRRLLQRFFRRNAPTRSPLAHGGAISHFPAFELEYTIPPSIASIVRATCPCVGPSMGVHCHLSGKMKSKFDRPPPRQSLYIDRPM